MKSLGRALLFSLFFLFSHNLYSLEIYQADCKNVEKEVQDIWKFKIDDESSYEAIKLQTQEFGLTHDNTTLNDESISLDILWEEGGSSYFEFFFEGPNAGLIFKDKRTEPLQGFFCEWSSYYADASESNVAVDNSKPHIIVELISYEDKQDYEDKPVCELEFTVTNNSFGTMYDYRISTETFDDRGDKMDEYAMDDKIDAFGDFWSFDEDIKLGNSATSKSLQLKGKCSYVQDIYMTEVKNRYCNIRMLPDGFDCLSLVKPVSKIDHINLQFK